MIDRLRTRCEVGRVPAWLQITQHDRSTDRLLSAEYDAAIAQQDAADYAHDLLDALTAYDEDIAHRLWPLVIAYGLASESAGEAIERLRNLQE